MGQPVQTRVPLAQRSTSSRLGGSGQSPPKLSDAAQHASGRRDGRAALTLQHLDRALTSSHWSSASEARAYLTGFVESFFTTGAGTRSPSANIDRETTLNRYNRVIDTLGLDNGGFGNLGVNTGLPAQDAFSLAGRNVPFLRDASVSGPKVEDYLRGLQRGVNIPKKSRRDIEIEDVARATGMNIDDVRAVFDEYDAATAQPFPGVIQPRSVPFLNTPVTNTARVLAPVIATVLPGAGLIEAFYGVDVLTGEKLSGRHRALLVGLELIPLGIVAKGGSIGGRIALRAGGRLLRPAAKAMAAIAARFGMNPGRFLRELVLVANLGLRTPDVAKGLYRKLAQGTLQRLTGEEVALVRELAATISPGSARANARTAARTVARELGAEVRANLARIHRALPGYLERSAKLPLEPDTISELGALFTRTSRLGGTYLEVRAASSELTVLEKLLGHGPSTEVRLIKPKNIRNEVRADFKSTLANGDTFYTEVTSVTSATRSQRGSSELAADGRRVRSKTKPPVDKTKPATSSQVREAFARKIKHGQINETNPGVIVVNVVTGGSSGPFLTAGQIAGLTEKIANKPFIRELILVVRTPRGRQLMRVGPRDSGLGLTDGVLQAVD